MRILEATYTRKHHAHQAKMGLRRIGHTLSYEECVRRMDDLNGRKIKQEERLLCIYNNTYRLHKFFNNWYFYRNFPVLANYFGDFVAVKPRLIFEINESYHSTPQQRVRDINRIKQLRCDRWMVIELWWDEPDHVWVERIIEQCNKTRLQPAKIRRAEEKQRLDGELRRLKSSPKVIVRKATESVK